MSQLVIFGAGAHARVVADILGLEGRWQVAGFIDDRPEKAGTTFAGGVILGSSEVLPDLYRRGVRHALVAVGDNHARLELAARLAQMGFEFPTAVHPGAIVARDVPLGAGTVITAGSVVVPGAQLGAQVIVNTASTVDHDCRMEDGSHLSAGVRVGGGSIVGAASFIGMGAIILPRLRMGARSFVGAGSVVVRDLPDDMVAWGVPARVMRRRRPDDVP